MAITLISGGTQNSSATNGGDVTLTFPTLAQGDVVYVAAGRANGGPTVNSAGWGSPVGTATNGTHVLNVWRKVMGASPDTSVQIEGGANAATATTAVCVCLRGVDNTTPEDNTVTSANGSSTNPNAPSVTVSTALAWVVAFASSRVNDSSVTVPSGMANLLSANATDTDASTTSRCTLERTTTGAYDPAAWTGWSTGTWGAVSIAVRPAPLPFTLGPTEAADTAAVAATDNAALAATEAADTVASTATVNVALSATEAADSAAFEASEDTAAGVEFVATEASDIASAGVELGFGLAATEAADTLAGVATVDAVLGATEGADAAAFTATANAELLATEAADTAAVTVAEDVQLAASELEDVASAAVTEDAALAATEAPDVIDASLQLEGAFELAASEAGDTAAAGVDLITVPVKTVGGAYLRRRGRPAAAVAVGLRSSEAQDRAAFEVVEAFAVNAGRTPRRRRTENALQYIAQ